MSNSWYFSITDNNNPNVIPHAMRILDQDMAANHEVSGLFYGFKRHGRGFGIEGYVLFENDKNEAEVGRLLPGMFIRIFNHDNDANRFRAFVCRTAIYTKWGMRAEEDNFTFEIQNHYHELEEVHDNNQGFEFAQ